MEVRTETPMKNDSALMTPMAIRCAKASHLLSSLKHQTIEESMKMKKEIGDLKVKVARERLKNKRIKLWGSFELLLQITVLIISLFALFLILIFSSL